MNHIVLMLILGTINVSVARSDAPLTSRTTITEESERTYDRSYPFVVIIQQRFLQGTNISHCIGLILSGKWVASSANCFSEMSSKDRRYIRPPSLMFRILAGSTKSILGTSLMAIAVGIYYHPEYDYDDKTYDFCTVQINFPFIKAEFSKGRVTTLPVASTDGGYIGAGLNRLVNIEPICTVVGWANTRSPGAEYQLALLVQLVRNLTECSRFICTKLPTLCRWPSRILGFTCARALQWAPCDGFLGAPVVCGTNVWATVAHVDPCTYHNFQTLVLLTRLDVGLDFIKWKMSGAPKPSCYLSVILAISILTSVL